MLFLQLMPVGLLCCLQLYIKPFRSHLLNKIDSFCLAVSSFQIMLALTFRGSAATTFILASLDQLIFIALLVVIVCQFIKKVKCCSLRESEQPAREVERHSEFEKDDDYDEMKHFITEGQS